LTSKLKESATEFRPRYMKGKVMSVYQAVAAFL